MKLNLKYILSAMLAGVLASHAAAETTETAVHAAIEECREWIESNQVHQFSPSWVNVVEDTHQGDTGYMVTRVYLSSQFPLEMTTRIAEGEVSGSPVFFRDCIVDPVDPSRGQYRYRLRPVEIGDTWSNLATLPLEMAEQQLFELQRSLAEDSTYVEDVYDRRPSSHGTNMTFWLCSNDKTLYYNVLPDGIIESSHDTWSASVHYASIPFEQSAPSRANCPMS